MPRARRESSRQKMAVVLGEGGQGGGSGQKRERQARGDQESTWPKWQLYKNEKLGEGEQSSWLGKVKAGAMLKGAERSHRY